MTKIRKAVFPVAGFGTRFLPMTKSMPKELLPILDKPLIQFAADEAVSAGIDTLIFITGRNKRAIEDHFDANLELENVLRAKGKDREAELARNVLPSGVECIFVRQAEQLGLGHAILCAERVVGREPFAILLADDFFADCGVGATSELVSEFERSGQSQISVMKVNQADIPKYGIVSGDIARRKVEGLVEKPTADYAPSNLASLGRYVLIPEIFDELRELSPGSGGEIQLSEGINSLAAKFGVEMVELKGKRFDCGSVEGYKDALLHRINERREEANA